MKYKEVVCGIITFIPGMKQFRAKTTGGTDSARYCYSVWLRHMVMAKINGLDPYPKRIAELGPGDSLGVGLAALLSGCEKYFAFDVVEYASIEKNLKIFDELVDLFKHREAIPGEDEFPHTKPYLDNYDFPHSIWDEKMMQSALSEYRIQKIKDSIKNPQHKESLIQYRAPWDDQSCLEEGSIDLIFSQAVLEHVADLRNAYKLMYMWLKSSGFMSHQIDFKCHGTADEWNGHWAYSDFVWKLIKGKRPYLLNREPIATHISILEKEGFEIACVKKVKKHSNLKIRDLSSRFKSISSEDLTTSGALILAVKNDEYYDGKK